MCNMRVSYLSANNAYSQDYSTYTTFFEVGGIIQRVNDDTKRLIKVTRELCHVSHQLLNERFSQFPKLNTKLEMGCRYSCRA